MKRNEVATTLLTGAIALYTGAAAAKNRCEADLGRVDTDFCLADRHTAAGALQYNWSANDSVFDLTSAACLTDGAAGLRRDMVLAIDRSQNVWFADTSRGKFGADALSTARYLIEKLRDESRAHPETAPKVSVVLFSSSPECRAWEGGSIVVNREFPCVYVGAGSMGDDAHVDQLLGLLKAADKKYSQGGLAATSDYGIVADLLQTDGLGLRAVAQPGLMLFSDGRAYRGDAGDPFGYLRSANYTVAQDAAVAKFSTPALKKYKTVFALTPVADPAFDETHADAYDNMCSIAGLRPEDCDKSVVDYREPKSWPVNKLDLVAFAGRLTAATTGARDVFSVVSKQDADPALEALRLAGSVSLAVETVSFSVNGEAPKAGVVENGRIYIESLPVGKSLAIELLLTAGGREVKMPMTVDTGLLAYDGKEYSDKEMLCKTEGPAAETVDPRLLNMQGGSGSCGVIAGGTAEASFALLLLPLVIVALALRRRYAPAAVVIAVLGTAFGEARGADKDGLNALQYRPVVDGIGTTEKATTLGAGTYNVGLFADYANDTVELGGDKNKRLDSIMDDLVTAHAVANFGLHERLSLGLNVPYVQKSDVDRDMAGESIDGGQLGQPSDIAATLKVGILKRPSYALSVMPVVTFSTGNPELLIGDGTNTYGLQALVSGVQSAWTWAYNTGYVQREKPLRLVDDRAHELVVRGQFVNFGGLEYRLSDLWSFGGNLQAKFSAGQRLDLERSSPAEWSVFGKMRPANGLVMQLGLGTGLGKGYGSPDYRALAGVSYVPGGDVYGRRASVEGSSGTGSIKPGTTPAKKPTAPKSAAPSKRPLATR